MEQQELFTKGFNSGYLIAKYQPELSDKLLKNLKPANDYSQGLISGHKEFEKEKAKTLIPSKTYTKEHNIDKEL